MGTILSPIVWLPASQGSFQNNRGVTAAFKGRPRWRSGKESACQCRRCKRCGFSPWARKIPWRWEWLPTPVFLPGDFHRQRSLVSYSPWTCKRARHDWTTKYFCFFILIFCSVSFTTLVIEFAISLHPVTSNIAPGSLTKNTWRGPYCMVWVHSPCCYFQSSMQFCNFQVSLDFGACCHLYCEEMLYALHCFLDHL